MPHTTHSRGAGVHFPLGLEQDVLYMRCGRGSRKRDRGKCTYRIDSQSAQKGCACTLPQKNFQSTRKPTYSMRRAYKQQKLIENLCNHILSIVGVINPTLLNILQP